MSDKSFIVIGITDRREQRFSPEITEIIATNRIFSGGLRHHEILLPWLPSNHVWIDITVPLEKVWCQYKQHSRIVVFASGDPLFHGYAVTLKREFPNIKLTVFPAFNSLQMLAHRILLPYADMVNVSLTGRDWNGLDSALIKRKTLIGILTDHKKNPAKIASRLLYYGYDNYRMYIGENLGNEHNERIKELSLHEAKDTSFTHPNCVILQQKHAHQYFFGIPEREFFHLEGREKMITKMPIRLLTISMLELPGKKSFWDIGFCTGSVSIEAKRQFPHLKVTAFERRENSRELMIKNCHKFGVPGIETIIADFMDCDLSVYPPPDAVFIGGHGGNLTAMIERIVTVLLPGGVIVFNSVSPQSSEMFEKGIEKVSMSIVESHSITLDEFNPIKILKAK
ncbi:MAG: precorrin-6y C5,15-methyltransferase (decarboxylating) subunit CbiE [Bacteroides sp.]|nr:precorrin-6y C5,15-methyltransferase (decarboxylating) subunit CbiE [Bacteroides sp.]